MNGAALAPAARRVRRGFTMNNSSFWRLFQTAATLLIPGSGRMSLLRLDGVSVRYGKSQALTEVSLRVEAGEIVTLIGANGAGKSTLMRAIMRLVPLHAGTIEYDGRRLDSLRTHSIAQMGIAYVPEGRGVLRELSVRENLVLGTFADRDRAELRDKLGAVMTRFPALAERLQNLAGNLSGGQQQMLVIGRALMANPKLLLLDEPSLGLAPLIAEEIFRIVAELAKAGVTVLLVEQNANAALKLANRAYVLETGRIVLAGDDLRSNKKVREAYFGELAARFGTTAAGSDANSSIAFSIIYRADFAAADGNCIAGNGRRLWRRKKRDDISYFFGRYDVPNGRVVGQALFDRFN